MLVELSFLSFIDIVVPAILDSLMLDPLKAPSVVKAFLQMKKFDIQTLIDASES
ncbi:MAG: hypothetical protein IPO48_00225 [Saprospiraceae bacterium]|nr:hypothetical protein [Saprospiraceae bacterium]